MPRRALSFVDFLCGLFALCADEDMPERWAAAFMAVALAAAQEAGTDIFALERGELRAALAAMPIGAVRGMLYCGLRCGDVALVEWLSAAEVRQGWDEAARRFLSLPALSDPDLSSEDYLRAQDAALLAAIDEAAPRQVWAAIWGGMARARGCAGPLGRALSGCVADDRSAVALYQASAVGLLTEGTRASGRHFWEGA